MLFPLFYINGNYHFLFLALQLLALLAPPVQLVLKDDLAPQEQQVYYYPPILYTISITEANNYILAKEKSQIKLVVHH